MQGQSCNSYLPKFLPAELTVVAQVTVISYFQYGWLGEFKHSWMISNASHVARELSTCFTVLAANVLLSCWHHLAMAACAPFVYSTGG